MDESLSAWRATATTCIAGAEGGTAALVQYGREKGRGAENRRSVNWAFIGPMLSATPPIESCV